MRIHDEYGKGIFRAVAASEFCDRGPAVEVRYTGRGGARIDGVVGGRIAVEVESRVSKQVRGAVLDLICHAYPKKLLALLPVHMSNPKLCREQCQSIFARFLEQSDYRVVVLKGTGRCPALDDDARTVAAALRDLGFDPSPPGG